MLRDAVLTGRYFGERHAAAAGDLARFLVEPPGAAVALWLGADAASILREPDRIAAILDHDIATIDAMIAAQLDAILHHPRLARLEGSWRGLAWLAERIEPGGRIKLRLLHLAWHDLCRDLERAAEFDQSQLFRRIYEDEFGSPGGEPYGFLVMDYDIRHRPGPGAATDDVAALASLSAIAAAAFSPMVFGTSPTLFGVDRMEELSGVANPAAIFSGLDYQRFRNLGSRDDMRFLGLALPRLRARPAWDEMPEAQRGFRYREQIDGGDDIVWFAAGYAVAHVIARAMATYEWPADMRGYLQDWPGGGVIAIGTAPRFSPDPPSGLDRFETELALTDAQERTLVDAGMMALSTLGFGGQSVLGAARSLQTPRRYAGPRGEAADANARLSAQLNTIICVSRFAHFVKVMGRDMTGAFRTAGEIERDLGNWLRRFTNGNRDAGPETRARYPLLDASVQVRELPGKPGSFGCTIHLQPHYQLDDIAASFRLVTELTAPGS
ncbi:MAG: type VI secretion system contractile sheath large subunit [Acidiphilium sp.]